MSKANKITLIVCAVFFLLVFPHRALASEEGVSEEPISIPCVVEGDRPDALGVGKDTDGEHVRDDGCPSEEIEVIIYSDAEGAQVTGSDGCGTQNEEDDVLADDEFACSDESDYSQADEGVDAQAAPQEGVGLVSDFDIGGIEDLPVAGSNPEANSLMPQIDVSAKATESSAEKELAARYKNAIKDGVYTIESSLRKGLVLDLHGSSEDNYLNVEVRDNSDILRQRWYIEHDEDGFISFYNMMTGKALDIYAGHAVPRENIQQYRPNGTKAQKWVAVPSTKKKGMYQIISALDASLALDVYGGQPKNGTNVWVYGDNGSPAQCFSFLPETTVEKQEHTIDDGYYTITTLVDEDFALDTLVMPSNGYTNEQLGNINDSNNMFFYVSYADGYYRIQNVQSESYLDAQNYGLEPRTNVCQNKKNGSASQEWSIVQDGVFCRIVNRSNGLALDVYNGTAFKGANVWLYQNNFSKAQAWCLKPYVPLQDGECYAITSCKNAAFGIEVHGKTAQDGANVQLASYEGSFSEKWIAHRNEDGSYSFESLASGLFLGASDGNVCQQKVGEGQISWQVVPTKQGFNFVNAATGLLMDINSGIIAEGTNIKLWKSNGGTAQRFFVNVVPILEERTYTIRLAGTNELVDVRSGKKDAGTAIQLFHNNGSNAQMWAALNNYDGTLSLVSERSGLAMSWSSKSVVQNSAGGGKSLRHRWIVIPNGDGTFALLASDGSGLLLSSESNQDRADVVMSSKGTLQRQSFVFMEATPREGSRSIPKVKNISFSGGGSVLIERGAQKRLAVDVSPRLSKQGEIRFSSADSSIVEVSSDGTLSALRPGTTTVTAQLVGGDSAITCEVTVSETKGQITREMLDMIARSDCNGLMIVSHPDDETFWGGAHLIEGDYLVICLTNGYNSVRRQEFNKAMDVSGSQRIILSYPDTNAKNNRDSWTNCKEGLLNDLLAVLSVKQWDTVVTHNQKGDTGHIHHKMTNETVTLACQKTRENVGSYYNFGTFYNASDRSIDQITPNVTGQLLDKKMRMVSCYQAEQIAYQKYWAQMMPHEHWEKMNF